MRFLVSRAKHVGHIAHWCWAVIYGLWTLVCSVDVLVEHYGSDSFKAVYNTWWITPKWGWETYIIGLLVITVFAILEGSYRHTSLLQENHRDALSKSEAARAEAEARIYDGRPLLVLRVAVIAGSREKGKLEYVFYIQNCGQRAARWVVLEQTKSHLGKYRLTFSRVSVVEPGKDAPLSFEACTAGYPFSAATVNDFLADNPPDAYVVWYDIAVEFRDVDESMQKDTARLSYWPSEQILSSSEVPYTRR
jgi:hypothetical protein